MRRLGAVLRVDPMMIYRHIPNKEALLDSTVERLRSRMSLESDDAVELYQSLAAFTVGFAILGSPLAESQWTGIPNELAERLCDWKDSSFRRTLRAIIHGYGLGEQKEE